MAQTFEAFHDLRVMFLFLTLTPFGLSEESEDVMGERNAWTRWAWNARESEEGGQFYTVEWEDRPHVTRRSTTSISLTFDNDRR